MTEQNSPTEESAPVAPSTSDHGQLQHEDVHNDVQEQNHESHAYYDDYDDEDDDGFEHADSLASSDMVGSYQHMESAKQQQRQQRTAKEILALRESAQVFWSRFAFLFVLFVAAGATAAAVFVVSRNNDEADFRTRYDDFANQVLEVSQINAQNVFAGFESMSLHVTAFAEGTKSTWPLITIPKFEAQAHYIFEQTGAYNMGLNVLVTDDDKTAFEQYHLQNKEWIQEGLDFVEQPNATFQYSPFVFGTYDPSSPVPVLAQNRSLYAVTSMLAPIAQLGPYLNFDSFSLAYFRRVYDEVLVSDNAVLSEIINLETNDGVAPTTNDATDANYASNTVTGSIPRVEWPRSYMAAPVYDSVIKKDRKLVALLSSEVPWDSYFRNVVPTGIDGIVMVVQNTCNQTCTFLIEGPKVTYLGVGDLHDREYDEHEVSSDFTAFTSLKDCVFSFHLYPTEDFRSTYQTNAPMISTVVVLAIFVMTALTFIVYDQLVERRQLKVLTSAKKSEAIVSSLFPANVRDRLMEGGHEGNGSAAPNGPGNDKENDKQKGFRLGGAAGIVRLGRPKAEAFMDPAQAFSDGHGNGDDLRPLSSQPIADFFPNVTVLFQDLVGFTAWSSTRDPVEVFTLLETLYNTFDKLAGSLGVFKVETIGDCYVAACGLPEPNPDHAVVMFRFAQLCIKKMSHVVLRLATTLGPGTAELCLRLGLHSGPVTAGVLRGQKSRFQLFGDTVNTAARMESTGEPNRIQFTKETADELSKHGKGGWCKPRSDPIMVKGKGELRTFWGILQSSRSRPSLTASVGRSTDASDSTPDEDQQLLEASQKHTGLSRLISWNVESLQQVLKKIVATRPTGNARSKQHPSKHPPDVSSADLILQAPDGDRMVVDEVKEVLDFPKSSPKYMKDPNAVVLDDAVVSELNDYVRSISSMYNENKFHSFQHASHVVQSVRKLLARMKDLSQTTTASKASTKVSTKVGFRGSKPSTINGKESGEDYYVHGIAGDPLVEFACVFSALIHDVDHLGLPNASLVQQEHPLAIRYRNKSVAEQHSVDVAWSLLMEPRFSSLRGCIYSNEDELQRFRDLVVTAVIATDIMDKDLKSRRHDRWREAFAATNVAGASSTARSIDPLSDGKDRVAVKQTVVLERLIQASDVAHTMQHWHVYLKWNERLFDEMYEAYKKGHGVVDPTEGWYNGELWFFDNYIIPLAEKLKECGVFGVSSDEYLNYARANRKEWEQKGRDVVTRYALKHSGSSRF